MTYEKKQAFEADSEKIEALQQPGQFPELVATDESLVALYNEQLADGQSLTPLQAEDRAMDDETNWTTLRTFFRRAQRLVSERLTVIVSFVSAVLTDVFGHLHERLDGNDEYGIPAIPFGSTASPAVAETLGTLPAAVRLLRSRKITNGPTDTAIPDGCSLARLLCDSSVREAITTLYDDNEGWVCDRAVPNFAGLVDATLNMTGITAANALNSLGATGILRMPKLTTITSGTSQYNDPMPASPEEIYMDELVESDCIFCQKDVRAKKISARKLRKLNGRCFYDWNIANEPLTELRLPELRNIPEGFLLCWTGDTSRKPWTNLILFEIGSDVSLNISAWSPTMALRTDTAADDYVDLREDTTLSNNLAQFLTNFRSVLFTRLAQRASITSLTLTLSPEVYKAVYGLDANYNVDPDALAQTASLADFGVTTEDLNETEIAAGITTATKYATWLDTYRGAIYWNVQHS